MACRIDVSLLDFDHMERDSGNKEILIPVKASDDYVVCQNRENGKAHLYKKEGAIWNEYRITAACAFEIYTKLNISF